ncbi:MarR family winged helix-turn-helix transcriptional regulator [Corynebacterium pelargi]|uniref:Organic hydroperoxide resistance transcriptional regulator n=1 Tax=Corynebacterium pelargi TaxID=1471400 RepID=A0A410W9I0_9CORY|nr:MarR family transcriptional regulator [Corynebacterium pelargi]QAU52614.1 Organic hydroperoxide resistance transcriptional regulator [Corynebacterium pelargi]GGG77671.1 transcriptional regulator [Corynebacterium pelargi]
MNTPQWLSDEEQRLWRLMLAANRKVDRAIEESLNNGYDLTTPEFGVLVSLSEHPEQCMRLRELCAALNWDRSRTSHQITRMERRGLVDKQRCTGDGRGVLVALTKEGERRLKQAVPEHVQMVRELVFDRLSEEQAAAIREFSLAVLGSDVEHLNIPKGENHG